MTNLTPDPISPEHAELTGRLAALGNEPVDPAVASAHLTAIAAVHPRLTPRPVRGRFVRSKVAVAFAAGLVLGGTSLASAGVLGNTPQNAVADAAGHVGLDLPGGTPRSTEGCGGQTYKNHGQFVSQGGDPHSPCGKPVKSTDKPGKADNTKPAKDKPAGAGADKGCGKPAWAGPGNHAKKTPAAVAQRTAACGDDDTKSARETPKAVAPTTVAPAPTTTVPVTTTTTGVTTTTQPVATTTAVTTTTEAATTTTAP
jgi:hypothetical protein